MLVRLKRSVRDGHAYEYVQLVRSYRDDGHVHQQVLATLGRREVLTASGQLDELLKSLGRFSTNFRVVEAVRTGPSTGRSPARGPGVRSTSREVGERTAFRDSGAKRPRP